MKLPDRMTKIENRMRRAEYILIYIATTLSFKFGAELLPVVIALVGN